MAEPVDRKPESDSPANNPSNSRWGEFEHLWKHLRVRASDDPQRSYTALLVNEGPAKIGRKLIEESAEVLIAALEEGPERVCEESADLLYHLLVMWCSVGIEPESVIAELARRAGQSGLEEKAARKSKG